MIRLCVLCCALLFEMRENKYQIEIIYRTNECIHFIFRTIVFAFTKRAAIVVFKMVFWKQSAEYSFCVGHVVGSTALHSNCQIEIWIMRMWYLHILNAGNTQAAIDMIVIFSIKFHVVYPTKMGIHVIRMWMWMCGWLGVGWWVNVCIYEFQAFYLPIFV